VTTGTHADDRGTAARFADLRHQREQLEDQLKALDKTAPAAADPALLDQLPLAGGVLPGLPPALKARLLAAFDIEVLWNKPGQQATVFAEITENTLRAIPSIMNPGQDGYHDTTPAPSTDNPTPMGHLISTPRRYPVAHRLRSWSSARAGAAVTPSGRTYTTEPARYPI
jgi:hypothetical protein